MRVLASLAALFAERKAQTIFCLLVFASASVESFADPVAWVNPYIGAGSGPIGYGGMMPFVTAPFGMTDWTPQTRQNKISGVS